MLKAYKYRYILIMSRRYRLQNIWLPFVYNQTLAYRKEVYEKRKNQLVKPTVTIIAIEN